MLSADSLQILAVTHPSEVIDNLLIPWDFESIPKRMSYNVTFLAS